MISIRSPFKITNSAEFTGFTDFPVGENEFVTVDFPITIVPKRYCCVHPYIYQKGNEMKISNIKSTILFDDFTIQVHGRYEDVKKKLGLKT